MPAATSFSSAGERRGRDGAAGERARVVLELAQDLGHHPVRGRLGVAARGGRRLEVVGHARAPASGRPRRRPGCRTAAAKRSRRAAGSSGSARAHLLDPARVDHAAAAGRARGSSGSRAPPPSSASAAVSPRSAFHSRVSCTTVPPDSTTRHLARDLVLDRAGHVAEGVQVLDLRARAERLLPAGTHRDVRVAAQRALLHVAVGDLGEQQHRAQRREVLGAPPPASAGPGRRRSRSAARPARLRSTPLFASDQAKPSCSSLPASSSMCTRCTRTPRRAPSAPVTSIVPSIGQRPLVLRDLVALRQVGVEVVLPLEDRDLVDAAAERERGAQRQRHRLARGHRQRARQRQAHGADERVRRRPEAVGAAAEQLRPRQQLACTSRPITGS